MRNACIILILVSVLSSLPVIGQERHVINSGANPQFLYVLSAKTGSCDSDQLTLHGINTVIYFSDRPNRMAGHLSLNQFAALWGNQPDSFKADPPNATLSIFDTHGNQNVVVELIAPQVKDDTITFRYQRLDGQPIKSFGAASLFVDAFPTPVNPQITD